MVVSELRTRVILGQGDSLQYTVKLVRYKNTECDYPHRLWHSSAKFYGKKLFNVSTYMMGVQKKKKSVVVACTLLLLRLNIKASSLFICYL